LNKNSRKGDATMTEAAALDAVTTKHGRVSGIAREKHLAFLGIPYAKAKRFGVPQAPDGWTGVRSAATIGLAAPQATHPIAGFSASGPQGEDCLNLNVFTPAADDKHRPVMFWIHGGGFTHGAGYEPLYNGGPLCVRGDVVLVTINYRLGALGFLRVPEIGAQGNQGLLDCIAALNWVRDNIRSFGGDPEQVTIFGESAGSAAVGCLLGMPTARGLFRRAIMESGAGRAATPETADRIADAMLKELSLDRAKVRELMTVDHREIVRAQQVVLQTFASGTARGFGPVKDPNVLPDEPIAMVRDGAAKGTDIVIGTTRDENKLFAPPRREPISDAALLDAVSTTLAAKDKAAVQKLVDTYRVSRGAKKLPTDNLDIFDAVATDVRFRIPSLKLALNQRAAGGKAYVYLFTHASPARRGALGSCHALELPFVFGTLNAPTQDRFAGTGPDVERLSRDMMDAWLAFARTGNPAATAVGAWSAYDDTRRPTMVFDTKFSRQQDDPFGDERRALEALL
jgi:para-nitrobenzyl esterase